MASEADHLASSHTIFDTVSTLRPGVAVMLGGAHEIMSLLDCGLRYGAYLLQVFVESDALASGITTPVSGLSTNFSIGLLGLQEI